MKSLNDPKVALLEKELEKARTQIKNLEKLYKVKEMETKMQELEILVQKQRDELDQLRVENEQLKRQNSSMQNQIERLSTLVYSSAPKGPSASTLDHLHKPRKGPKL